MQDPAKPRQSGLSEASRYRSFAIKLALEMPVDPREASDDEMLAILSHCAQPAERSWIPAIRQALELWLAGSDRDLYPWETADLPAELLAEVRAARQEGWRIFGPDRYDLAGCIAVIVLAASRDNDTAFSLLYVCRETDLDWTLAERSTRSNLGTDRSWHVECFLESDEAAALRHALGLEMGRRPARATNDPLHLPMSFSTWDQSR